MNIKGRLATAIVAATLSSVGLAPVAHAETSGPARVLIEGDSVTQGRVGDYTWRYRLWKDLAASRHSVDFVGPHTGLADGSSGTTVYDATGYADPSFDQDHAARWGMMATAPEYPAADLAATYAPDVVVNYLGINDLIWGTASPSQLVAVMAQYIADVRSVRPTASFVIGQLPETWIAGVTEYNTLLPTMAATLDTPTSRVLLAAAPTPYTQAADTSDGLHPNAQGEIKIARSVAAALAALSLPTLPAPPPPPPTPPAQPTAYAGAGHLRASATRHAARLRFTVPAGATGQTVMMRNVSAHGRWHAVAYVSAARVTIRIAHLRRHRTYAFALRARSGTLTSTRRSNVVRVRTR